MTSITSSCPNLSPASWKGVLPLLFLWNRRLIPFLFEKYLIPTLQDFLHSKKVVNIHIYWYVSVNLDPIRPRIEIAFLQNNYLANTICSIGHTLGCLLSLGDPFVSIVSKLVDIHHRYVHDFPDCGSWSCHYT